MASLGFGFLVCEAGMGILGRIKWDQLYPRTLDLGHSLPVNSLSLASRDLKWLMKAYS